MTSPIGIPHTDLLVGEVHVRLFYASNADPPGVIGLATIANTGYPDHFAWKKGHQYFDADTSKDKPTCYMVDVAFVERTVCATGQPPARLSWLISSRDGFGLQAQVPDA